MVLIQLQLQPCWAVGTTDHHFGKNISPRTSPHHTPTVSNKRIQTPIARHSQSAYESHADATPTPCQHIADATPTPCQHIADAHDTLVYVKGSLCPRKTTLTILFPQTNNFFISEILKAQFTRSYEQHRPNHPPSPTSHNTTCNMGLIK
jgi:hypothetical protein